MAHHIALGYEDEAGAVRAESEIRRLAREQVFAPTFVRAVRRDRAGRYRVSGRHGVAATAGWDTLRGAIALGALAYRPLLRAVAAVAALAALFARRRIDPVFEQDVRDRLSPGASALLLVVDKITPDEVLEALSRLGGTVLRSSLSREAEHELEDALRRPSPDL
jgi:uncharacterized membrane protein